jgi:hypothetical protein
MEFPAKNSRLCVGCSIYIEHSAVVPLVTLLPVITFICTIFLDQNLNNGYNAYSISRVRVTLSLTTLVNVTLKAICRK